VLLTAAHTHTQVFRLVTVEPVLLVSDTGAPLCSLGTRIQGGRAQKRTHERLALLGVFKACQRGSLQSSTRSVSWPRAELWTSYAVTGGSLMNSEAFASRSSPALTARLVTTLERLRTAGTAAADVDSSLASQLCALLENLKILSLKPSEATRVAVLLAEEFTRRHEQSSAERAPSGEFALGFLSLSARNWRLRSRYEAFKLYELKSRTRRVDRVPWPVALGAGPVSQTAARCDDPTEAREHTESDLELAAVSVCAQLVTRIPQDVLTLFCSATDACNSPNGRKVLQFLAGIVLGAADGRILRYFTKLMQHQTADGRNVSSAGHHGQRQRSKRQSHRRTSEKAIDALVESPNCSPVTPGATDDDVGSEQSWDSHDAEGFIDPSLATDPNEAEFWDAFEYARVLAAANRSDASSCLRTASQRVVRLADGNTDGRIEEAATPVQFPTAPESPLASAPRYLYTKPYRHSVLLPAEDSSTTIPEPSANIHAACQVRHPSMALSRCPIMSDADEQALILSDFPYHAAAYAFLHVLESCAAVSRPNPESMAATAADPLYLAFSTSLVLPAFAFVLRNDIMDRSSFCMRFPPLIMKKAFDTIRATNEPRFGALHRLWRQAGLGAFLAVAARRYSELGEIPLSMLATDAACVLAGKWEDCFGFLVTNRPESQLLDDDPLVQTPEQHAAGRRRSSSRGTQSERRASLRMRARRLDWRSRRPWRPFAAGLEGRDATAAAPEASTAIEDALQLAERLGSSESARQQTEASARTGAAASDAAGPDTPTAATTSAPRNTKDQLTATLDSASIEAAPARLLRRTSSRHSHSLSGAEPAGEAARAARPRATPIDETASVVPAAPETLDTESVGPGRRLCCASMFAHTQRIPSEPPSTWLELLRAWRRFNESDEPRCPPELFRRTQRLVRRCGIPDRLRKYFWPLFLEVEHRRGRSPPNWYRTLLRKATAAPDSSRADTTGSRGGAAAGTMPAPGSGPVPREVLDIIDRDVTRTFCNHRLFWRGGAALGLGALRNILRAYACLDPAVGYCQGMSSITGALYIYAGGSEERCFFMLVQFMQGALQFREFFLPGFTRLCQSVEAFAWLLHRKLPRTARLLEAKGITPMMFADKWYLTALLYNFPFPLVSRVWDALLLDGHVKVLHRATLTLLKRAEHAGRLSPEIPFEDLLMYLQRGFATDKAVIPSIGVFMNDVWHSVSFSRRQLHPLEQAPETATGTRMQHCAPTGRRMLLFARFRQRMEAFRNAQKRKQQAHREAAMPRKTQARTEEEGSLRQALAESVAAEQIASLHRTDSAITSLDSFYTEKGGWKRDPPPVCTERYRRRGMLFTLGHRMLPCVFPGDG